MNPDGSRGAIGAAITLHKGTLQPDLRARLEREGVVGIPLPKELIDYSKQQKIGGIRSRRQMELVNMVDIGSVAKCVGLGYMSLANLRKIPGLEAVMIEDPLGGGKFNSVSKVSMAPRDDSLKVKGFKNLLVAGEKAGPGGGITEVICTGILAGNNAVRIAVGREALLLPQSTAIGDFVAFTGKMMETPKGLSQGYSASHGVYFERMKELGFYSPDPKATNERIRDLRLKGILAQGVI